MRITFKTPQNYPYVKKKKDKYKVNVRIEIVVTKVVKAHNQDEAAELAKNLVLAQKYRKIKRKNIEPDPTVYILE